MGAGAPSRVFGKVKVAYLTSIPAPLIAMEHYCQYQTNAGPCEKPARFCVTDPVLLQHYADDDPDRESLRIWVCAEHYDALMALGWMDAASMPTSEEVSEFIRREIEMEN